MFTLEHVVPWGRSFDEYRRMFALSDEDLRLKIIGCGDGPASFNAVATRHGSSIVSCDPIYRYDLDQLRERIAATYDEILKQTRQNAKEFVWTSIRSPEELGETRLAAMKAFLDDYDAGRFEGRYLDAELPNLPFRDRSFDLALSSHFLFLYTWWNLSLKSCEMKAPAFRLRTFPTSFNAAAIRCFEFGTPSRIASLGCIRAPVTPFTIHGRQTRRASICPSQRMTWFQLALFWSTNLRPRLPTCA